jgi:hypothetical protein
MNGANQDEEEDWCWTRAKIEECIASRADIKHTKHTYKIPQIPFPTVQSPSNPLPFCKYTCFQQSKFIGQKPKIIYLQICVDYTK